MSMTLVTYYSRTGNTKIIAESIYEALEEKKEIKPVEEVTDVSKYSLIFVGFPVHSHSVPYKIEIFLKNIPSQKKIALFFHPWLSHRKPALERSPGACHSPCFESQNYGNLYLPGKVSPKALEVLSKSPEHQAWTEMAVSSHPHPDEKDKENKKKFARWVVTLSSQQEDSFGQPF